MHRSLFTFFNYCNWFENGMVSMERCLKYTSIEEEKYFTTEKDAELESNSWPNYGEIEFVDYSVRYRPNTEIVLKNINLKINPGEKIGVVGRTGSGKSTICLCLFRILEPLEGTIKIDQVDITQIGLNILRKNLTIIPQDPSLMKGTLRYNIDPLGKSKDEEINNVLDMIGLTALAYERNPEGLDRMIGESGENLSVGEKQLICIARAILRVREFLKYIFLIKNFRRVK
jgi:ABC-type multidrug transport system fused ATPase/permease subunit